MKESHVVYIRAMQHCLQPNSLLADSSADNLWDALPGELHRLIFDHGRREHRAQLQPCLDKIRSFGVLAEVIRAKSARRNWRYADERMHSVVVMDAPRLPPLRQHVILYSCRRGNRKNPPALLCNRRYIFEGDVPRITLNGDGYKYKRQREIEIRGSFCRYKPRFIHSFYNRLRDNGIEQLNVRVDGVPIHIDPKNKTCEARFVDAPWRSLTHKEEKKTLDSVEIKLMNDGTVKPLRWY